MSEELDWELYDIFEAGLFPFPIYDHQTARKIIRYLLYRGVLDEEIADAIEDSTADLHIWLNRSGKNMVGEWVIAWVNDVRNEYRKEKTREARERGFSWHDYEMGSDNSHSDGDDSSGGEGDDPGVPSHGGRTRRTGAHEAMRAWSERMRAIDDSNAESSIEGDDAEIDIDEDDDLTDVKRRLNTPSPPPSPPPLPPRSDETSNNVTTKNLTSRIPLEYLQMHCSIDSQSQTVSSDISPRSHVHWSFTDEHYQQTPDSGAVSDIYSSIPPDRILEMMASEEINSDDEMDDVFGNYEAKNLRNNEKNEVNVTSSNGVHTSVPVCTAESHISIANRGIPSCPSCRCSLIHYSVIPKLSAENTTTTFSNLKGIMSNGQIKTSDQAQLNLYITEATSRAMQLHIDTLDKDGPGFIFIMTDTVQDFLPWSSEHRYKIASSRKPERWLTEFRTRNIDIDLIWQVKVRNHLMALREVHINLQRFNLHSNWFKCSLSKIMDVISRVVRKYRV